MVVDLEERPSSSDTLLVRLVHLEESIEHVMALDRANCNIQKLTQAARAAFEMPSAELLDVANKSTPIQTDEQLAIAIQIFEQQAKERQEHKYKAIHDRVISQLRSKRPAIAFNGCLCVWELACNMEQCAHIDVDLFDPLLQHVASTDAWVRCAAVAALWKFAETSQAQFTNNHGVQLSSSNSSPAHHTSNPVESRLLGRLGTVARYHSIVKALVQASLWGDALAKSSSQSGKPNTSSLSPRADSSGAASKSRSLRKEGVVSGGSTSNILYSAQAMTELGVSDQGDLSVWPLCTLRLLLAEPFALDAFRDSQSAAQLLPLIDSMDERVRVVVASVLLYSSSISTQVCATILSLGAHDLVRMATCSEVRPVRLMAADLLRICFSRMPLTAIEATTMTIGCPTFGSEASEKEPETVRKESASLDAAHKVSESTQLLDSTPTLMSIVRASISMSILAKGLCATDADTEITCSLLHVLWAMAQFSKRANRKVPPSRAMVNLLALLIEGIPEEGDAVARARIQRVGFIARTAALGVLSCVDLRPESFEIVGHLEQEERAHDAEQYAKFDIHARGREKFAAKIQVFRVFAGGLLRVRRSKNE